MIPLDISRVWKNEAHRLSLSEAEWALPPDNPAALIELMEQLAIRSGALVIPIVDGRCARKDREVTAASQVAKAGNVS